MRCNGPTRCRGPRRRRPVCAWTTGRGRGGPCLDVIFMPHRWPASRPGDAVEQRERRVGGAAPLPGYARPGRLARRPRQFMLSRVARFVLVALALAIALPILGLAGVHEVTDHFRIRKDEPFHTTADRDSSDLATERQAWLAWVGDWEELFEPLRRAVAVAADRGARSGRAVGPTAADCGRNEGHFDSRVPRPT